MSDPLVDIIRTAAEIKRAAPNQYEEFVKSFHRYADRAKNDLMASPKDGIFQAQGKAHTLAELVKRLEDCLALDDQYRKRS